MIVKGTQSREIHKAVAADLAVAFGDRNGHLALFDDVEPISDLALRDNL
jgi:hypothetical protein